MNKNRALNRAGMRLALKAHAIRQEVRQWAGKTGVGLIRCYRLRAYLSAAVIMPSVIVQHGAWPGFWPFARPDSTFVWQRHYE